MSVTHNKLVRDNIPAIILADGKIPITHTLSNLEYLSKLEDKLREECEEVISASGPERLEELADVIEVIRHLARCAGSSLPAVITLANQKRDQRGGFNQKIFLEQVLDQSEAPASESDS